MPGKGTSVTAPSPLAAKAVKGVAQLPWKVRVCDKPPTRLLTERRRAGEAISPPRKVPLSLPHQSTALDQGCRRVDFHPTCGQPSNQAPETHAERATKFISDTKLRRGLGLIRLVDLRLRRRDGRWRGVSGADVVRGR